MCSSNFKLKQNRCPCKSKVRRKFAFARTTCEDDPGDSDKRTEMALSQDGEELRLAWVYLEKTVLAGTHHGDASRAL
jgi:hypothetical protein